MVQIKGKRAAKELSQLAQDDASEASLGNRQMQAVGFTEASYFVSARHQNNRRRAEAITTGIAGL